MCFKRKVFSYSKCPYVKKYEAHYKENIYIICISVFFTQKEFIWSGYNKIIKNTIYNDYLQVVQFSVFEELKKTGNLIIWRTLTILSSLIISLLPKWSLVNNIVSTNILFSNKSTISIFIWSFFSIIYIFTLVISMFYIFRKILFWFILVIILSPSFFAY